VAFRRGLSAVAGIEALMAIRRSDLATAVGSVPPDEGPLAGGTVPLPRNGHASSASSPRQEPAITGGPVPADDELLERTLTFSGSYVSDDGHV